MWGTGVTMRDQTDADAAFRHADIANYVATLSSDLAGLADESGLELLKYLLDMVRLEAENVKSLDGG